MPFRPGSLSLFALPAFERSKAINLAVIFKLSLYALIALASAMLMISEGFTKGVPPQTFTIVVLIAAFLVVDHWKLWSVPWWAAGSLGLLGLAAAFWEVPQYVSFSRGAPVLPEERRLDLIFAGAHLLVFLTWIVLFLQKTNQQYWWLWGLALLQVAVGASQSTESLYGMLLIGFLFLAVWTLSVFSLLQGQEQFDRAQQVAEFMEAHGEDRDGELPSPVEGTWRRPSRAIGSVQRDPSASWIDLRFLTGVLGTAGVALVLAMLFFFLIPRHPAIWRQGKPTADEGTGPITGFSRHLALGDIGEILESTKKVMEVELTDARTGEALSIEQYASDLGYEEPLFRGMTALHYEGGQWRTWESDESLGGSPRILPGVRSPRGDFVRQHYRLEPIDTQLLFAIPPVVYGQMDETRDPISVERLHDILSRPEPHTMDRPMDYSVISPRSLRRPGMIPVNAFQNRYIQSRIHVFQSVPPNLENLRQLAVEKAGAQTTPRPDDLEIARRLESYLKDSGEFGYTLKADVSDSRIDPLEDFLFNRKVGHCEYFASALAMMLRSVGIPSRLVSGFKGGNYNDSSGRFEVEERHAHAWVEAYIEGHWVVLDPTPASRAESVANVGAQTSRWEEFRVLVRDFWSRFIVNLNGGQQRRLLEPFKKLATDALAWMRNGRGRFTSFVAGLKQQLRSPERWISWQGGLVTFVLLTFLSGFVWLSRVLRRLLNTLRSRYFDPQGLGRTVAFYERFRRICRKAGLSRKTSQTPREFAVEVKGRLRNVLVGEWDGFPVSLVDAYYDVRYGGRQLSAETIAGLEQQLNRFESLLSDPK